MRTQVVFDVSTLAGVTRIVGGWTAGDYAYDTITTTNVERVQFADTTMSLDTSNQHIIEGTNWNDNLTGTSGDDFFDGRGGGSDTVDGLGGSDTLLIFEDSSLFDVSTLAGVTRIVGGWTAGDYAYDTITTTNVERVQFADTTMSLDTSNQHIIEGTNWNDNLTGTSGDDFFDGRGGSDTVDGLGGSDTLLIFEDSSLFDVSTLAGVTRIVGGWTAGDYAYDTITTTNVERVQFADTTMSLDTSNQHIIEGTNWNDNLTGTSGDDFFDGRGGG